MKKIGNSTKWAVCRIYFRVVQRRYQVHAPADTPAACLVASVCLASGLMVM